LIKLSKLGPAFWLPFAWIALVIFCAIGADFWNLPEPDHIDWSNLAAAPGARGEVTLVDKNGRPETKPHMYVLGTDNLGRDILARLIFGARVSLAVGLAAPAIGLLFGGLLGMLSGFYRGRLDSVVMAGMDTILAFPGMVLLLAITFYLGANLPNLVIVLGFLAMPTCCRVARAKTLAVAEREFVQASRALGASGLRILLKEILPNVLSTMVAYAVLIVAVMIVIEGALSFLGLGVPPPTPSWGGMIAEGREVLEEAPHVSMIPAFIMFLTVLSFNLIGDSLRRLRDVKARHL
jgi:peptide/nickel transport system permease protein